MSDSIAAPVKGMINAFSRGKLLAKRICRHAQNGSSAQTADMRELAQALQRSLESSEDRLRNFYAVGMTIFGRRFGDVILNDAPLTNRLQALTINFQDQIMGLDEYMDDPESFDVGQFSYIAHESERCCNQAIIALGLIQNSAEQEGLLQDRLSEQNDRIRNDHRSQSDQIQRDSFDGPGSESTSKMAGMSTGLETNTSLIPATPERSLCMDFRFHEDIIHGIGSTKHGIVSISPGTSPASYQNEEPITFKSPHSKAWRLSDHSLQEQLPRKSPTVQPARKSVSGAIIPSIDLTGNQKSRSAFTTSEARSSEGTNVPVDQASLGDGPVQFFIKSEEVLHQVNINEQLLERRRQTRVSFEQKLISLRKECVSNSPIVQPISSPSPCSSGLGGTLHTANTSVVPRPSHESLSSIATRVHEVEPKVRAHSAQHNTETPVGFRHSPFPFSPDNVGGRSSVATTSSLDSTASIPLDFASLHQFGSRTSASAVPLTPPISEGRQSGAEDIEALSRTLKLPDFGKNVVDGIQVFAMHDTGLVPVTVSLVSDPGIMLADESCQVIGPTSALREADTTIGHEVSFYSYGGFCVGAKKIRHGEIDAMKVVMKSSAGVKSNAAVSMRCIECAYEVGRDTYENDKTLDRSGILNIPGGGGIRFRQRFLSKSHLHADHVDRAIYACIFCIEESMTVHSHDATVFFSVDRLLQHIQKHARPLKFVEGIIVLYGEQPDAIDFDLCFKDMDSKPDQFVDIEFKLSTRPTARALMTHRDREKGYQERGPDGNKPLNFAKGAKIVGVTYPPRFNGQWCYGYHDGEEGYFPASTIQLNPPCRDDIIASPKTSFVTMARWEHKPKDPNSDWLSFKPKEKIINVSFAYKGHWCWYGTNMKGRSGIFPAAFVDGLIEVGSGTALKTVGAKAMKAISAGAEERWSSNTASGMWTGIGGPIDPANAPRPVRRTKKIEATEARESPNQASDTLDRPNSNIASRSESVRRNFFSRRKRATNDTLISD